MRKNKIAEKEMMKVKRVDIFN